MRSGVQAGTLAARVAAVLLVLGPVGLAGQSQLPGPDSTPEFQVDFSNPGLSPSHWTLVLHPDGSGHFRSTRGTASGGAGEEIEAADVDRDVIVSAEFAGHVFQMARQHNLFNTGCESHMKVAFQGWKKLSYRGSEGTGSCEFNYSKDKDIEALGDSLVAVGGTIIEGARLETLLQHDRLGLDSEMEYLSEAAKDGRAQQISTIRDILARLADEPSVMERVRKRARMMLSGIGK
jgi:hypothetical protein